MMNNSELEKLCKSPNLYSYIKKEFDSLREDLTRFKPNWGNVEVYLQGSHKNHTSLGRDSDIDIVVNYNDVFRSNVVHSELETNRVTKPHNIQEYKNRFISANYSFKDFKKDLASFLKEKNYNVEWGNKTLKVWINSSNYYFDVVPTYTYRFYDGFTVAKENDYEKGAFFYDQNDKVVINFPFNCVENCKKKMKNTEGNFKKIVRMFKRIMKNKLSEEFWIPSFALECLLYNCNDKYFLITDLKDLVETVVNDIKLKIISNWNNLNETNEILLIKNIKGVNQVKCMTLLSKIGDVVNGSSN